ncbi:MAG: translesion error-prone DNA polymerase V autoproteolytic subunit [Candidatus Dojkabacteria bacterium]|nr:translesion error-prone DNA polymerase V autoproteolytic subunit [Candidatus Dojkabacteria bacterium]
MSSIQLFLDSVPAGFPSPATDYIDKTLDINEYLVKHPAATFFVRVSGDSMIKAGIHNGDILVIDKSLEPVNSDIVLAVLDSEYTVKRFLNQEKKCI